MATHQFSSIVSAERVDIFLSSVFSGLTRRKARKLCDALCVKCSGKIARSGQSVQPGMLIEITGDVTSPRARPELVEDASDLISVEYIDDHLAVVCKPRAMHSVTLSADDPVTLADCVAALGGGFVDASPDAREAGLVQRLDYYTSGLVIAAREGKTWGKLRENLNQGKIAKSYVALVEGQFLERGTIESPVHSLSALTTVEPVKDWYSEKLSAHVSLVAAKANIARRHQIRVHLGSIGHPLVGDKLYGSIYPKCGEKEGFYLHAGTVSFEHPLTGDQQSYSAELPELSV